MMQVVLHGQDTMKHKSEAKNATQKLIVRAQGMCNKKVRVIETDNAKELKPNKFLLANGTATREIPPYSLECNSRVEKANRTIVECARTLLQDLFVRTNYTNYKTLWPEACQTAVYINK